MTAIPVALLTAFLAACATIQPARMALPSSLAGEPTLVFEGMGFGQKGGFAAGPYAASFTRSGTRLALLDALIERRSGKTSFALEGPGIDGTFEAERRVGSIELKGEPAVRFAPGADAATRRAVMVAATALGVLWDSAESALGREAG